MPLTDALLRSLRPRHNRYTVTDGRGLAIEVFPTGGMGWRYRYQKDSRTEKVSLGKYPQVSLKDARVKRDELAVAVARGSSPAREKQKSKKAVNTAATVGEFGEKYFAEVVRRDRKNPINLRRYLDKEIYPALGHRLMREVSAGEIQLIVYRKRDHGFEAAAADLRNLCKRMWDYGVETGVCTINPAKAVGMRFITSARSRTRALSPDEIREYLKTLYRSNIRRQFKLALHLITLTLVRKSELLLAEWKDIRLDAREWHIPAQNSKTGRPHIVYLSDRAIELFKELRALASDSKLVLPGRSSLSRPFASNALNKALEGVTFSIPPFTIHDLRRTGSTRLHEMGYPSDVIEAALNHQIGGVRGIYNRAKYETQRREMLQAWGEYVAGLAGGLR
ncbi:MAG: hypothetical protein JWQ49_1727 [Edaphobacter sp.]|nr:hypothetical protein [Edaphobacter sp.]